MDNNVQGQEQGKKFQTTHSIYTMSLFVDACHVIDRQSLLEISERDSNVQTNDSVTSM